MSICSCDAVAPVAPCALVQPFGAGFRKTVGKCLDHDGVIVVVLPFEGAGERLGSKSCRRGERAKEVGEWGFDRRDEVGERQMGCAVGHLLLLPQHRKASRACPADLGPDSRPSRFEDHDVVAAVVRRPEAVDRARVESTLSDDDAIEQHARVVVQLPGRTTVLRMLQDAREAALELPCGKEKRPVDVGDDLGEVDVEDSRIR